MLDSKKLFCAGWKVGVVQIFIVETSGISIYVLNIPVFHLLQRDF